MRSDLHEPDLPSEARRLWRLGWPISLGMLGLVAMGTTDTIVVGWTGEGPLSGLALGNIWSFSMLVVAYGALRALDPIVSQAFGGGDDDAIRDALARGLAFALWLSLPMALWLLLAVPGLTLLGQPETAIGYAGAYALALIPGIPLALLFNGLRSWLQGFEVMRPATVAILAANLLNIPVDLLLVHGLGPLPALGPAGAGIATSLCNGAMFLGLAWLVRDQLRTHWTGFRGRLTPTAQLPLLRHGLPLGLQTGLEVWAFNASGLLMGWFGETALSAHTVALNLASLTFMYAMGLSQAAATRVGNLLGAQMPWQRAGLLAIVLGGLGMTVSATLFVSLPGPLAGIYTQEVPVRLLAAHLIPIAGAFQIFDGLQVTMFGVLRGAGDIRIPTLANVLGYWLIGIPTGAALAFGLGWGPTGVWMGLVIGLAVVAAFLAVRLAIVMRRGGERLVADAAPS